MFFWQKRSLWHAGRRALLWPGIICHGVCTNFHNDPIRPYNSGGKNTIHETPSVGLPPRVAIESKFALRQGDQYKPNKQPLLNVHPLKWQQTRTIIQSRVPASQQYLGFLEFQ
ncbi:hypothetical protein BDV34DRAFT_187146 [Aspergillus parasiticus]|uniref:Uncharacterized protein n=1 Tax=Aspergillus parasiticus TaxID=5067 RepID=A0A5N6DYA7_ASPPA|nr:hypothetical protein BDV34DRAFT_187146 [Aspergillus parasiticus]